MRKRKKKGQRKNTCSKCGHRIEASRGGQRYCKKCHAGYMRLNRKSYSNLTTEQKLKANARSATRRRYKQTE